MSAVQEAVARLPIWPASDRLSVEDAKQRLALLRFLLSSGAASDAVLGPCSGSPG